MRILARKPTRWRLSFGLLVAAVSLNSSPNIIHAQNQNGFCSSNPLNQKAFSQPLVISAGQSTTTVFYITCENETTPEPVSIQGQSQTDPKQAFGPLPKGMTFSYSAGPPAKANAQASGAFAPTTLANIQLTISTALNTPPAAYTLLAVPTSTSSSCKTFVPCGAPGFGGPWLLTVTGKPPPKPKISSEGNKNAVWWFNGAKPSGFTKKLTLTATQAGNNKFTWSVDGKYAKFVDATSNPAVLEADCEIGTPCPPQGEGMVSVTVTGLEVTSDPFPVSVLTPYQANPLPVPPDDPDNKGAGALFYFSHIPYQITDQFGKPLPKKPPVREHFTASAVNQCPNCNWHASHEGGSGEAGRLGSTGCSTAGPGIVCDTISGQAKDQLPFVPSVPTPECPNNNCTAPSIGSSTLKVLCFPGELWIGNGASPPTPPTGVKVMTMIWERYQDHGRHCNILSPLDGSGSVTDACTCP